MGRDLEGDLGRDLRHDPRHDLHPRHDLRSDLRQGPERWPVANRCAADRPSTGRLSTGRPSTGRRSAVAGLAAFVAFAVAGCAGLPFGQSQAPAPAQQQQQAAIGSGDVRVALILPLSGSGNAGPVAQAMRNAAELALSEFQAPDIQLLVKDDGGNPFGAQTAAQAALDENAEVILGPLFAATVSPVGRLARARNIPVMAFSTDSSVAARGVYLLSFLPESDVDRIIDYASSRGRRSFAALIPDNAYGNVVDGAFRQAVARNRGRVVTSERVGSDPAQIEEAVRRVARGLPQADALFIPGDADTVPQIGRALANAGVDLRKLQ